MEDGAERRPTFTSFSIKDILAKDNHEKPKKDPEEASIIFGPIYSETHSAEPLGRVCVVPQSSDEARFRMVATDLTQSRKPKDRYREDIQEPEERNMSRDKRE